MTEVSYGIVQQSGGDGYRIHFHFGQNQRYFQRVNQIGLAGGAALAGMMFLGKFVGLADEFKIVIGAVGPHPAHQLTELGHREDVSCELLAQGPHARL